MKNSSNTKDALASSRVLLKILWGFSPANGGKNLFKTRYKKGIALLFRWCYSVLVQIVHYVFLPF